VTVQPPAVQFSAMPDRAPLRLASGERVILWTIVNVEHWSLTRPMPRQVLPPPMGGVPAVDRANWSWHEYGLRVGFWRMLDLFGRLGIPVTLALNGSACTQYARVTRAAVDAGWELMGHGFDQMPMQQVKDEADSIRRTLMALEDASGQRVRGWESPGLTGTERTLDLLAAAGVEYVSDLVLDEQPCLLSTQAGTMTALPYTVELNDVVLHAVEKQPSDELNRRAFAQLRQLSAEAVNGVRVMSISLHPYLSGVPHRFGYLQSLYEALAADPAVKPMTGSEILDWYRGEMAQQSPMVE